MVRVTSKLGSSVATTAQLQTSARRAALTREGELRSLSRSASSTALEAGSMVIGVMNVRLADMASLTAVTVRCGSRFCRIVTSSHPPEVIARLGWGREQGEDEGEDEGVDTGSGLGSGLGVGLGSCARAPWPPRSKRTRGDRSPGRAGRRSRRWWSARGRTGRAAPCPARSRPPPCALRT
eukprot:scaffold46115_cov66-Phaeocystis_antarctica.AAC.5